MLECVGSGVLTEMDAMDSIVLSTCDACCSIQLLCHMLSPPYYPLQLPTSEPLSQLDDGYMSDLASGGLLFLRRKYHQMVVQQVHCQWPDDLISKLIEGHAGAPIELEQWLLGSIPCCECYNLVR